MQTINQYIKHLKMLRQNLSETLERNTKSQRQYREGADDVLSCAIDYAEELKANMEADDGWIVFDDIKKKTHPSDCGPFLCRLRMNDGECPIFHEVLDWHYSRSQWNRNGEYISNWHTVTHYMNIPSPPKGEK